MSDYYTGKRTYSIYAPGSKYPYKLSRSRIENYIQCKRCFYIDRRLGVDKPPGFPFTLNSAVDRLLKKEFDIHRANGTGHPLFAHYKVKAVPMAHKLINVWRDAKQGIQYLHAPTNFLVFGGIDDVWQDEDGKLIVVDYKATAKEAEVNLDAPWQAGYKRQAEIYQWLFRKNGYEVSEIAYFVYCNGRTDRRAFDAKLEFDVKLIPYKGNDSWIDKTLIEMKKLLDANKVPQANPDCDYCLYLENVREIR